MIAALARAGLILDELRYLDAAERAVAFIRKNLKDSDGLMVFDIVHIITKNLWKEIEAGMRLGGNLK